MKKFFGKLQINSRGKEMLLLVTVILLQSVVFICAGLSKSYIHMDEAYSLALISYDKVEIQDNEDFYNTWHDGSYYMDYMVLDEEEAQSYRAVYDNQRDDVHPPLYYLLLRFAMGFAVGEFTVWPGIILNMIIYAFVTVFTYLILQKLFDGHGWVKEKSLIFAFMCSVSLASVSAVIYLRMYALVTLWVLITVYLHILLLEKNFSLKLLVPITLVALAGSLTHYYYLFFLFAVCVMTFLRYARKKEWKYAFAYFAAMLVAAGLSLAIFPYSIEHMFFGYRGEGALSKMIEPAEYFIDLGMYLVLTSYSMSHVFFLMVLCLVVGACILAYNRYWKKDTASSGGPEGGHGKKAVLRLIYLPVIFYFVIVSIASPWHALRYIMPICGLVFILLLYGLYWVVCRIMDDKMGEKLLCAVLALLVLVPVVSFSRPQEVYLHHREVVERVESDCNLPTVYFYDSDYDRFLDDIYLFAKLDESYIAEEVISHDKWQDIDTVREIFEGKDTSEGVLIFINGDQQQWVIINTVREALGKEQCELVAEMNACEVYRIY